MRPYAAHPQLKILIFKANWQGMLMTRSGRNPFLGQTKGLPVCGAVGVYFCAIDGTCHTLISLGGRYNGLSFTEIQDE